MRRNGFTLLEVLVTLIIVSMLATAIYGVFVRSILDTRGVQETEAAQRLGQAVLALIERDLKGCFDAGTGAASMEGLATTADTDAVHFLTTTDSHTLRDGRKSDISEAGYLAVASGDEDGLYRLYRREEYSTDGEAFSGGTYRLLDDRVKRFQLEYFDGSGWLEAWAGEDLPAAVRVRLTLARRIQWSEGGEAAEREFDFRTLVRIPAGSN